MIKLLDMKKASQMLTEVKSMEYTVGSRSTQFHPEGLFSEIIFGPKDSPERKNKFAYIDLHCKILHPALVKAVGRLNSKIIHAINKKFQYNFDDKDNLVEIEEDGEINGITSVITNFKRIVNARTENTQIRQDIRKMLLSYFDRDMVFIDKCIVIPPFWREANIDINSGNVGLMIPPVNDLYQKIIKLSIQINSLSMDPGSIIYEIHAAKMQQLVNDLFDYLITRVSKKSGLVRQQILGKRLDFCGRAVIVGGSAEIKPDEIGVPFKMLVKLFEPFILHDLYNTENNDKKKLEQFLKQYNDSTLSIVSLRALFTDIQKGHVLSKEFEQLIKDSVNRVIKDKVVLGKRDPALHAESIRGYKPVMVDGDSIKLTPTACTGHNADFDGDQMAIYVTLTKESMQEVKSMMCVPYSMNGMNQCCDDLSKDFCIGLYNLTKDNIKFEKINPRIVKSEKELKELHPNYPIIVAGKQTTVGRYIYNKIAPTKDYRVDVALNKKTINGFIQKAANEFYSKNPEIYTKYVNELVRLGGLYYTIMPATFCIEDLVIPQSILNLKEKLKLAKSDEEAQQIIDKMEKLLKDYLEENQLNLGVIGRAGGLKNGYGQVRQILICKGIIQGAGGKIIRVPESYAHGMKSKDLFNSGYGARNGIADRVLNTADTGYLARKLAYAMQRVEGNYQMLDCGSRKTIQVKVTPDIAKKLTGRYVYNEQNTLEIFDASKWMDKIVRLRSPIYCRTTRICRHCYGELLGRNKTNNIGILAAQILGERVSQSSMKQFHVGGAISIKVIDIRKELTTMLDSACKSMFDKQFKIDGSKLICTNDGGKILISNNNYDDKEDFYIKNNVIYMNYGYFVIDMGSYKIDCTIDNKIEIPLDKKNIEKVNGGYVITFNVNDLVFVCVPTQQIFSKKAKMIENIMSGKTPYKSPDHFMMKIYNIYEDMGCDADLVHYETVVSNLLRDSHNPSYPARLNPKVYQPKIISLTAIPIQESWLQAFCFQNSKEAITNGLLYDRNEKETILEKLVTGNL